MGALICLAGAPPSTHAGFIGLTSDPNYYIRLQLDVFTGGTVVVTFSVSSAGTFNVWVMTAAQHADFLATGTLNYLAADSGSSGTFTATLPSGGTYYVETGHGTGYETTAETGVVSVVVNAWAAGPVQFGIGVITFGAVLTGIGLYYRTKPDRPKGYATPPPYVPAGAGTFPPGTAPPPAGWGAPPALGTAAILVTLENASAVDESVQILVNGAPAVSLTVPAGRVGQAHVRAAAAPAPGSTARVEAITGRGARAGQDVLVVANGSAQVSLRIG